MIAFIKNNPLLILVVGVILAIALTLLLIKVSGVNEKPKKKAVEKKSEDSDKIVEIVEKEPEEQEEQEKPEEKGEGEEGEEKEEKDKNKKPKKEVEPVFKSETPEPSPVVVAVDERVKQEEEQLLDRMEFVKTTDKVYKLAAREKITKVPESEFTPEEMIAVRSIIDKATAKKEARKPHHFDRSIRLSNYSKSGNYDAMFVSHILDEKTKVNIYSHLDINEDFLNRLYERTYNTIKNSGIKSHTSLQNNAEIFDEDVLADIEGDKREDLASYLTDAANQNYIDPVQENSRLLNENDLSARNIYVVNTIMNRKNKYKRK